MYKIQASKIKSEKEARVSQRQSKESQFIRMSQIMRKSTLDPQFSAARMTEKEY
jgi:hypothetical protein